MIRFYSLFVSSDEQLASPYVRRFSGLHDFTLKLGKKETVNFLLQTSLPKEKEPQLKVIYDPVILDLKKIDTKSYFHQTLITITLVPKEIGSMRIGFSIPNTLKHTAPLTHRLKIDSPLKTIACNTFQKAN